MRRSHAEQGEIRKLLARLVAHPLSVQGMTLLPSSRWSLLS